MDNIKEFFDKNAEVYSSKLNKCTILARANFIKKYAFGKVLDLGIGDGQVASLYTDSKRIKEIVGVDISRKMLKECNKRLNIQLLNEDIEYLNLKRNSFDTIILSEILPYLKNYKKFIGKCKNLLKENGRIIIITHNPNLSFLEPISVKLNLTPEENIPYYYSVSNLKSSLLDYEFGNVLIESFTVIPFRGFEFVDKLFLNKFGFKVGITAIK